MTRENQIELVKEAVTNYFIQHADHTGVSDLGRSERAHIIEIGASILCTKWEVGYEGGGFVQAFVANDLMNAIGRADSTTYKGFKFFASLVYNVGAPSTLFN